MAKIINAFIWSWNKLIETRLYKRWHAIKDELDNQKLNREQIGVDRLGNRFY